MTNMPPKEVDQVDAKKYVAIILGLFLFWNAVDLSGGCSECSVGIYRPARVILPI